MKKWYVSLAAAAAMAASASAVEVNPFGHLGAFYHQGFGGFTTQGDNRKLQNAYANVSARVGLELGLSKTFSIGLGGWGAYPFYDPTQNDALTKAAFPHKGDVSDAYVRYDGGRLSFALGRFDMGEFFLGKDGKNYTGVDWIYGNVQGGAINVDGGKIGLWGYWRNSQLGAGQAFNRMGYELSSFNTYQSQKGNIGELISGGVDVDFGVLKVSPFASYLTQGSTNADVLNGGVKAQLELGSGNLKSITALRAVFGMSNLVTNGNSTNGVTLWIDEELRLNDIFKFGAGYISQGAHNNLLNFGDRARFYGYRGGMSGAGAGGIGKFMGYGDTYYVFGGIDSKRVALDVLYAGGNYKEISVVGSLKVWEKADKMYLSVGAGYVGTSKYIVSDTTAGEFIQGLFNGNWQNSALAFAKFGF